MRTWRVIYFGSWQCKRTHTYQDLVWLSTRGFLEHYADDTFGLTAAGWSAIR